MHLTSLGSSFASGPGISPCASYSAYRSAHNYPSILASLLHADRHVDVTMAGTTLEHIISKSIRYHSPQVDSVKYDDDVVTITAGGNDIGYIGDLLKDSFSESYFANWMQSGEVVVDDAEVIKRFHTLFDVIRTKSNKAKIVVVGYPILLGKDATTENTQLKADRLIHHRQMGERLEKVFVNACKDQKSVSYVSVWEQSLGHGVGSVDAWVNGPTSAIKALFWAGPAPWHPNGKGMEEIARIVKSHLSSNGFLS